MKLTDEQIKLMLTLLIGYKHDVDKAHNEWMAACQKAKMVAEFLTKVHGEETRKRAEEIAAKMEGVEPVDLYIF